MLEHSDGSVAMAFATDGVGLVLWTVGRDDCRGHLGKIGADDVGPLTARVDDHSRTGDERGSGAGADRTGDIPSVGSDQPDVGQLDREAFGGQRVGLRGRLQAAGLVGGEDGLEQIGEPGVGDLSSRDLEGGVGQRSGPETGASERRQSLGGVGMRRQRPHARGEPTLIFLSQCVFGLMMIAYPALRTPMSFPLSGWALLLGIGLLAAAGQLLMTYAFKHVGGAEGALLGMLTPVGNVVLGVLVFREALTGRMILGGAVVLAACAYAALPPGKRAARTRS